jgi:hypothetical protein
LSHANALTPNDPDDVLMRDFAIAKPPLGFNMSVCSGGPRTSISGFKLARNRRKKLGAGRLRAAGMARAIADVLAPSDIRVFEHAGAGHYRMPMLFYWERPMPNNAVALVLTIAEAGALFETANLGMARKAELGMSTNKKALEALKKIAPGMGFNPKVQSHIVQLLPPLHG